jgi:phage host-nuclease inhibitor protein Gam
MAKTREQKVVHSGVSTEEMETAFTEFATCDAKLQKINATIDIELTRIREKYSDTIDQLLERKDKAFDIIQAFATDKKDELFTKKKSMETIHGTFGFRTGTPKLKLLKGFTWASVTNMLKEFLPAYVRVSEEPAKDKLLADRDNDEVAQYLPKVGISVIQEETFFVEPKKEA